MGGVLVWLGCVLLILWAVQAVMITWLYRSSLREYERPLKLRKQIP